jgi:hypothetical protein
LCFEEGDRLLKAGIAIKFGVNLGHPQKDVDLVRGISLLQEYSPQSSLRQPFITAVEPAYYCGWEAAILRGR